ncbi:MAG: hypothetical protein U1F71_01685 [Verrucomicrobiaceae bacterium]
MSYVAMNRARWITSIIMLFLLWSVGALMLVPRMQRDLEAAAGRALENQGTLQHRLDHLRLSFEGQQALLRGSVRTIQDRLTVETTVRDLVRAKTPLSGSLGLRLNPVSSVLNEIEVMPNAPGWLLLAANGTNARLFGNAASEFEARDLQRSVQESWSAHGGVGAGDAIPADDGKLDEAADVSATLRSIPLPQPEARAHLARIGQAWRELQLQKSDDSLRAEARAVGVTDTQWDQIVLPALHELRAARRQQVAAAAEHEHQLRLPAGHVFVATRGTQVILRGEVGSESLKQTLLNDALATFAPRRVHDAIRVSATRRHAGDFGPITTALLPKGDAADDKSLFIGFTNESWKVVDWQVASDARPWQKLLPGGVDAGLLQNDSAALIDWLQGSSASMDGTTSPQLMPSFITLAVFDQKVMISGQVAEEATHAQIIAAARRTYSPRFLVLHDSLHLRSDCRPSNGIQHTLRSLPAPPEKASTGIFAIASPGESWTVIPATPALVEAGGLAESGRLPAGLPASLLESSSAEAIERLRQWLATL